MIAALESLRLPPFDLPLVVPTISKAWKDASRAFSSPLTTSQGHSHHEETQLIPSRPSPIPNNSPDSSATQRLASTSMEGTLETEKPKFARGDRLGFQRTLVELILSVQATGGEPPPSTMAIVSETVIVRLCSVCLHSAETKSDRFLPRATRPVPRRVSTLNLRFYVISLHIKSQLSALSSIDPLYAFDLEIEKTLRRLRRTRNLIVNNSRSSDSVINSNQFCTDNSVASSNIFAEPGQMENNDRTLKELATPDVVYQPWCIQYPQLEPAQTYELKSGLIHVLPKFHGLAGEDPHKHLKEFHVEKLCMSTGKGSTNSVPPIHTIRSASSC
ncbi:hypothetical protein CR513_44270, partial [Mucuna pruriens]